MFVRFVIRVDTPFSVFIILSKSWHSQFSHPHRVNI